MIATLFAAAGALAGCETVSEIGQTFEATGNAISALSKIKHDENELRKKAEQGDLASQLALGDLERNRENPDKAAIWYRKAADQGDARAQYALGVLYLGGGRWNFKKQDMTQVVFWYRKAAEQGYPKAQNSLGVLYSVGNGVPKDMAQAAIWYRKAAEQGDASSQIKLAKLYHQGKGVEKDDVQAKDWYRKGALQGRVYAQDKELSEAYPDAFSQQELEVAIKKSQQKTVMALTRSSAYQGRAYAQVELGKIYETGTGSYPGSVVSIKKNPVRAAFWYRKAADQGHLRGQFNLGKLYEQGVGVPKDQAQAMVWYQKVVASSPAAGLSMQQTVDFINRMIEGQYSVSMSFPIEITRTFGAAVEVRQKEISLQGECSLVMPQKQKITTWTGVHKEPCLRTRYAPNGSTTIEACAPAEVYVRENERSFTENVQYVVNLATVDPRSLYVDQENSYAKARAVFKIVPLEKSTFYGNLSHSNLAMLDFNDLRDLDLFFASGLREEPFKSFLSTNKKVLKAAQLFAHAIAMCHASGDMKVALEADMLSAAEWMTTFGRAPAP